ncbi:MAG: DUF4836 family protein [Prevotellaceae bacterium]|nr:DUF4836 family protein [Prevotellaceae bacterium]
MKKRHFFLILVIVLAVAVVFVVVLLCLKRRGSDCSAALPKGSQLVARVDVKALLAEDGISLSSLRGASLLSKAAGIDFSRPAYCFVYQGNWGAVVPLRSRDKFFKATAEIRTEDVEYQRGLYWTTFGGSFMVVADGRKAIIIGPVYKDDELRNSLYTWMKQKSADAESIFSQELKGREEPVVIATDLTVLHLSKDWLEGALSYKMRDSDFLITAGLHAQKNKLITNLSLTGRTHNAQKFLSQVDEAFKPLDGSLWLTAPANPFMHLEAGVDGEKFLQLLRLNPDLRTKLLAANMVCDLDMIINSFSGDVALTMPMFRMFNPPLLLQANLADTTFINNVGSWNEGTSQQAGVQFVPARNDCYLCSYNRSAYYFGVHEGRLRFTTSEAYSVAPEKPLNSVPEDAAGCKFYADVDFSSITNLLSFGTFTDGFKALRHVTLSSPGIGEWTLTCSADEDVDFLKNLLSL